MTAPPAGAGPVEVEIDGRVLTLTNLDRVLWPEAGFTKGAMIDYYREVAVVLLPHVAGRPLTMWRFPEGVDGPNWFQTNCRGAPAWMRTAPLPDRKGGVQRYCLVDDVASLVWVANQGSIELHPFLAPADRPDEPAVAVFDLDPGPPADVVDCGRVALRIRDVLDGLGLATFPKTSGSIGLQVYVPLNTSHDYGRTKGFAREVARALAAEQPDRVVDAMPHDLRRGKVFIDWGQNDARRSTVAPYSLRGSGWPTVSTPVTWDEVQVAVDGGRPEALTFDAAEVLQRVQRSGDLFGPVVEVRQTLPSAERMSGSLLGRLDSNQD